ncbi:MFS transporter [Halalkalibacter krulwichiae]|uniref:Putative nitrate transporter NarT n=1 Tax=Halalkalibacter krulwichiae TaxID=199441 RepID=A0A1X9M5B7_9BACI|nr:nitrate/nitrite transporter [Halalkalibacter krulwichiae]ARK28576.1 putative nitrate transporter NarT [Halalkalibacter krulwichiae]
MKKKEQISVLILSTLAMIVSFTVWSVFSPIANTLQEHYQLSEAQKSSLIVAPIILGSLMRIPVGIIADKYGARKVYTITMLFTIFPMIAAGFANSFSSLLFWGFFIGMAGTTFTIAVTYVTKWFPPEKQGFVLGIIGIGNLGTAIASLSLPSIVNNFGLQWAFWGLAVVLMIMTMIFWFGTRELSKSKKGITLKESLSVTRYRSTWLLSLYYFLTFGGFVAFGFYLPTLLQESFHLSAVDSGLNVAGFVMVATFIRPLGGYIADKYGANQVLVFLFSGITLFATLMAVFISHFQLFSICLVIMAILLGLGNGAVFKLVPAVSPTNTGAVTGIISAVGGIGGFFPPLVMGVVNGVTGSYSLGFVFLALFALSCLLINFSSMFVLSQRNRKFLRKSN